MRAVGRVSEGNSFGVRNAYSPYVARASVILEDKLRRGEHHSEIEFGEFTHNTHRILDFVHTVCIVAS